MKTPPPLYGEGAYDYSLRCYRALLETWEAQTIEHAMAICRMYYLRYKVGNR